MSTLTKLNESGRVSLAVARDRATLDVISSSVERAVRDRQCFYPRSEFGKLAIDGSVLDRGQYEDFVYASAWIDPACQHCLLPEFRYFVPRRRHHCQTHPFERPVENPWPMSRDEREACEARVWRPIAARWSVPTRYHHQTLASLAPTPAVAAVKSYVAPEDEDLAKKAAIRTLVLAGPTGVGKTAAAIAGFREYAVWEAVEDDDFAFYVMSRLSRLLLDPDERDETISRCIETEFLVLDDLGAGAMKSDSFVAGILEEIVVERESNQLCGIFTTNVIRAQVANVLGDRIADRFAGSWALWIDLPGASLRRRPRPAK